MEESNENKIPNEEPLAMSEFGKLPIDERNAMQDDLVVLSGAQFGEKDLLVPRLIADAIEMLTTGYSMRDEAAARVRLQLYHVSAQKWPPPIERW
jgi:hypothetical protein